VEHKIHIGPFIFVIDDKKSVES